jgi:hypothetical protein
LLVCTEAVGFEAADRVGGVVFEDANAELVLSRVDSPHRRRRFGDDGSKLGEYRAG